jgi:hypothetical protein
VSPVSWPWPAQRRTRRADDVPASKNKKQVTRWQRQCKPATTASAKNTPTSTKRSQSTFISGPSLGCRHDS